MISAYIIHILILIGIFAIFAISLNIAIGFTGLINLGHVAFFGIGAYTSTILVKNGCPWLLAFLAAGVLASLFGFLLALATRKIKNDYFALATLAFAFVVHAVLLNWFDLTRGAMGIAAIPKPQIFGLAVSSSLSYLIFTAIIVLLCLIFFWLVTKSPYGRLLEAVRDEEVRASVMGKNVFKVKYQSLMMSTFWTGLAGSIYAHYISYIDPASFHLRELILVLTILIIGGLASLKGSIIAAFLVMLIPEALRFFNFPPSIIGPIRQIIFALILLLVLMYKPRGLWGKVDVE